MAGSWGGTLWGGRKVAPSAPQSPTGSVSGFPSYPDAAFPNLITVRLCDDAGDPEGGFNPVPGQSATFPASVQDRGSRWEARHGVNINVSSYYVFFQTNPNLALPRPIRNGDQVEYGGGILTVVDRIKDRGGFTCLWRLKCELVDT